MNEADGDTAKDDDELYFFHESGIYLSYVATSEEKDGTRNKRLLSGAADGDENVEDNGEGTKDNGDDASATGYAISLAGPSNKPSSDALL